jgi:hypothetical protein
MNESILIGLIGVAGTILSGIISFTLGQRAERQKQSLLVRAKMLKPIDEWLKGGEKMVNIFSYTISSVAQKLPLLIGYDFNEREKVFNFISEKTNEVLGIIASNSLQTRKTKRYFKELSEIITELDKLIKFGLLPKESEIVDR